MKKQLELQRGFSVIEMLVVIGVLGILSLITIGYSRRGEEQIALGVERAKLASALLRSKSLAIQTFRYPPGAPIPCGFGVHVESETSRIVLFKDLPLKDANGFPLPCPSTPAVPFFGPPAPFPINPAPPQGTVPPTEAEETIAEYTSDSRILVDLCYEDIFPATPTPFCFGTSGSTAAFDIMFTPPNPDIFFALAEPTPPHLFTAADGLTKMLFRFYLRSDLSSYRSEIVVNTAGQVSTTE